MPVNAQQQPAREPARVFTVPKPAASAGPPRKQRITRWLLWAGLIALVAVGAEAWWSSSQAQIKFETVVLERGSIEANITATGTLNPVVNVQVGSQVSGNIQALYADFNTKVKKGQLVALIDPQIFQAQVDQAGGAEASASVAVATAGAQIEKAKADLAGASASKNNLQSVLAKDRANALNAQLQ